jgi:hypothetical protein
MKNLLRLKSASATAATTIIAAPGEGKQVVIVDILASGATNLSDGSTVIVYAPAGSTHLRSGIAFGDNKAVVGSATANVTITYFVEEITP